AHDQLREPAGKSPVVVRTAQRPIESGRRNLERVRDGERVLDVEDGAHLAAHLRAVLDADAFFGSCRRTWPIDIDADHEAGRFAPAHEVPHLETARAGHPLSHGPNLIQRLTTHK